MKDIICFPLLLMFVVACCVYLSEKPSKIITGVLILDIVALIIYLIGAFK